MARHTITQYWMPRRSRVYDTQSGTEWAATSPVTLQANGAWLIELLPPRRPPTIAEWSVELILPVLGAATNGQLYVWSASEYPDSTDRGSLDAALGDLLCSLTLVPEQTTGTSDALVNWAAASNGDPLYMVVIASDDVVLPPIAGTCGGEIFTPPHLVASPSFDEYCAPRNLAVGGAALWPDAAVLSPPDAGMPLSAANYQLSGNEALLLNTTLSDVPPGSDIWRAIVELPLWTDNITAPQPVQLIGEEWDANSATWLWRTADNMWTVQGGTPVDIALPYNILPGSTPGHVRIDVTRLLQEAWGSFGVSAVTQYGWLLSGWSGPFYGERATLYLEYGDTESNQPAESPTPTAPIGVTGSRSPVFEAIINDDNLYGASEGDDLHFRIEVATDPNFQSVIVDTATNSTTTGWAWSASGDWSDASTQFPIAAGTYQPGVSRIRWSARLAGVVLPEQTLYWRIQAISDSA